jgi:Rod binding domain-containing protein
MMQSSITASITATLAQNGMSALAAGEATTTPKAKAREVAIQFEEIFVQQMVTAMRTSADGIGGGMFGADPGADTYSAWFDQCMSDQIADGGGIGLARMIEKNILQHTAEGARA